MVGPSPYSNAPPLGERSGRISGSRQASNRCLTTSRNSTRCAAYRDGLRLSLERHSPVRIVSAAQLDVECPTGNRIEHSIDRAGCCYLPAVRRSVAPIVADKATNLSNGRRTGEHATEREMFLPN
jgi:hypothetical protein